MKDGPDKYLYRKDQKQKLVGSADNSPEDGEEELEEAPGDFYNVDGYIYRQHEIEDDEGFYKRWHYMLTPDGEEIYIEYSPYQDMDLDEFKDFVAKFRRGSLKENDMTNEINEMRRLAGLNPILEDCDESEDAEKNDDGDCSPFTHADENVDMVKEDEFEEEFLAPPKDLEDGHYEDDDDWKMQGREDNIQAFDRDMSDSEPFGDQYYDESQALEEEPTRKDFRMVADLIAKIEDPSLRHSSAEDHADMFALQNPRFDRDKFLAACGVTLEEISDPSVNTHVGREFASSEFGGEGGNTHVGRKFASGEIEEEGPGDEDEFAFDDDAIVDVGDDEDYEVYDFDDEFEQMMGNTNRFESTVVEMNEIRRLAGLDKVNEDKGFVKMSEWYDADPGELMSQIYWQKSQLPPPSDSPAYAENWNKVVRNLSKKFPPPAGWENPIADVAAPTKCDDCGGSGRDWNDDERSCRSCKGKGKFYESAPDGGDDYSFIDFEDEKAYYLVADEIGDRIIFGMHNEVGIPEQYIDSMIGLLRKHGFEKGIDFNFTSHDNPDHISNRKAAEVEEDLQNGYNDRDFVDGEDFFPKGSHQSPSDDLGPGAAKQGDNPMSTRMRSVEKDSVYEGMRQSYRRFRLK